MNNVSRKSGARKFFSALFTVILVFVFFAVGIYAFSNYLAVRDNTFETGTLKINLNDGKALLSPHEYQFEPGITVQKSFFIKNEGTVDAYYKLYFTNITGELADHLEVTIKNGDVTLYQNALTSLLRESTATVDKMLLAGETHTLTVILHMPENVGNTAQSKIVTFELGADAVQAKNNPHRFFD